MKQQPQSQNLLELRPLRLQRWESREGDLITLLIPKFKNRWAARWILPRMARPDFKVRLDALGSFIWQRCDGQQTVKEIADGIGEKFGPETDPRCDRLALFLSRLASRKIIQLQ